MLQDAYRQTLTSPPRKNCSPPPAQMAWGERDTHKSESAQAQCPLPRPEVDTRVDKEVKEVEGSLGRDI